MVQFKKKISETISKFKSKRTTEEKIKRIEAKQRVVAEKQKLVNQRLVLKEKTQKLRQARAKAVGLDTQRIVQGTERLSMFASSSLPGLSSDPLGRVTGGQSASPSQPGVKRFRTVKTVQRLRVKSGKRKGKFRTKTVKKRIPISSPQQFDPFSQF